MKFSTSDNENDKNSGGNCVADHDCFIYVTVQWMMVQVLIATGSWTNIRKYKTT